MNELINVTIEMQKDVQKLMALAQEFNEKYSINHFKIVSYEKYAEATIFDRNIYQGGKNVGFFAHEFNTNDDTVNLRFIAND